MKGPPVGQLRWAPPPPHAAAPARLLRRAEACNTPSADAQTHSQLMHGVIFPAPTPVRAQDSSFCTPSLFL